MALTDTQILDQLRAGNYKPVYLLTGEENYFIDMFSDFFENQIVDESLRDFDQTVLYGLDVESMTSVITACKQFPMMSPVKLVLIKEAQNIKSTEWERLLPYLENPAPQTVLVFCYRHKAFDKRSKIYKAIDKYGMVINHDRLYDDKIPAWIGSYVHQFGHSITQRAAILLSECIGNDLGKITNELSKLFTLIQPGSEINEDLIERNIGISKEYNVFELQKAIGRRDVAKCNRIVQHFATSKDNPIQLVLPVLYAYFIKVMIYHQVEDKADAASALKVSPYFLRDYETAAQNYTLGKLASCIGFLNEADLRSKGIGSSNNMTEAEIYKELIFKIIH